MQALPPGLHSSCWVLGSEFAMRLATRKNKFRGFTLRRGCLCSSLPGARDICPVHALSVAVAGKPEGALLFPTWAQRGSQALLQSLRRRLCLLGVPNFHEFGLHSLRRGQAQQILDDGGSLADVLRAGQWSSPAFLLYLDFAEVEQEAVMESWCFSDDEAEQVFVASMGTVAI